MGFKEIRNYQLRPVKQTPVQSTPVIQPAQPDPVPEVPVQVPVPILPIQPDPEPHTYVQVPDLIPEPGSDNVLESLFEPVYTPVHRPVSNPEPDKRKFTITIPRLPKITLSKFMFWKKQNRVQTPVLQVTQNTGVLKLSTKSLLIRLVISGILIYFGVTTSGSYFGAVSGRLTGDFAKIFYAWGFGYLMMMIGLIVIYDTYKHYY